MLVEEDLAGNAEKMGKRLREGIASFNSPLVTEIRGRGLLNAIVIDESLGKNASSDGLAWDICVNMAELGEHKDVITCSTEYCPPLSMMD